ncbi:DinB family protein [Maribacter sp. CXY002]|uniref:DinB family protein n=1 Tax=Maribacter luteocoastalis TaxID=3407671 RepID=UPI003B67E2E4
MIDKKDDVPREFWLRGPLAEIPDLLQPSAHALLQTNKELYLYTKDFPEELLWEKVGNRASVGFHMQHITGVLDRMLTYARQEDLSPKQLEFLLNEGVPNNVIGISRLQDDFTRTLTKALDYFKTISEEDLKEKRTVGRKKLPTTVIGLLFHAAEHSQRHIGQLLVTVEMLKLKR